MVEEFTLFKKEFSSNNKQKWGEFKKTEKVLWTCPTGHDYSQSLFNRLKGYKCPYCSGKKILVGFNDLASNHPELVQEWHPTLNEEYTPYTISRGSTKKVWWLGKVCGHEWLMSPNSRTASLQGCAVCAGLQVNLSTSLVSTHPKIAENFDIDKNLPLTSFMISSGSHKKVWWRCEKGIHQSYLMPVKDRVGGHGCPLCGQVRSAKARMTPTDVNNSVGYLYPKLADLLDTDVHSLTILESYKSGSNVVLHWSCEKGHKYEAAIYTQVSALNNTTVGCMVCWRSLSTSTKEKNLQIYISDLLKPQNIDVIFSSRKVISPYELDIYVPEKNIAVEFNGLYWHSEAQGKGKTYHYDKWKACKDKGIQLIQVWEDDWNRNPELVKRMLAHKLGVTSVNKKFARKLSVVVIDRSEAKNFLDMNHIQGFVRGSIYLGLVDDADALVAVMVGQTSPNVRENEFNLLRYATSVNVIGGFTKLLNFVMLTYKPTYIVTFSDNTVSDGGLYEKSGFRAVKELSPDYMYVYNKERKHKFGFRLKRFRNDVNFKYVEGLTERELAQLNGLSRIWDAGKIKWVKTVPTS